MAKHFIKNEKAEMCIGLVLFAIGCLLLWDVWPRRGKNTPWPLGVAMPF